MVSIQNNLQTHTHLCIEPDIRGMWRVCGVDYGKRSVSWNKKAERGSRENVNALITVVGGGELRQPCYVSGGQSEGPLCT